MNAAELAANPRLDGWWVQDLNRDPVLHVEDASRGAVLVCVGVQYLQRPVEVFAEAACVLHPGGRVIVSYSNRCFHTKAVAAWLARDMARRAALVVGYMEAAGFGEVAVEVLADGRAGDLLVAVDGRVGRALGQADQRQIRDRYPFEGWPLRSQHGTCPVRVAPPVIS